MAVLYAWDQFPTKVLTNGHIYSCMQEKEVKLSHTTPRRWNELIFCLSKFIHHPSDFFKNRENLKNVYDQLERCITKGEEPSLGDADNIDLHNKYGDYLWLLTNHRNSVPRMIGEARGYGVNYVSWLKCCIGDPYTFPRIVCHRCHGQGFHIRRVHPSERIAPRTVPLLIPPVMFGEVQEIQHFDPQKDWFKQPCAHCKGTKSVPGVSPKWITDVETHQLFLGAMDANDHEILENDRLKVFSDILEENGFPHQVVLDHLRDNQMHCSGCWAMDLILGRHI